MMQKRLIIYLNAFDIEKASWIALDESNNIMQSVADGLLKDCSSKNYKIFVVVPCKSILLTQVKLPKLSPQKLRQALPFALEEQLIDDIDTLHFAIGKYQENETVSVAVLLQSKMTEWLQVLAQYHISAFALIPSIFILPYEGSSWQVNIYDDNGIIRTGECGGFTCQTDNLKLLLDLQINEQNHLATNIVYTELSDHALLEKYGKDITTSYYINLLQGAFKARPRTNQIKKVWTFTLYLMIGLIVLLFINRLVSFIILQHQENSAQTEITKIYRTHFPNATSIVAPKERMSEKLHLLSASLNKNNFLAILGSFANAFSTKSTITIQHLDFRDNRLTLEVVTTSFDDLDHLSKKLSQQGLHVKQQNAATSNKKITATLIIQADAS